MNLCWLFSGTRGSASCWLEPLQPALSGARPAQNLLDSFRMLSLTFSCQISGSEEGKRVLEDVSVLRRYRYGLIKVCSKEHRRDKWLKIHKKKNNPVCGDGTQKCGPRTSQKDMAEVGHESREDRQKRSPRLYLWVKPCLVCTRPRPHPQQ